MKINFSDQATHRVAFYDGHKAWTVRDIDDTLAREQIRLAVEDAPAGNYDVLVSPDGTDAKTPRWMNDITRGYDLRYDEGKRLIDSDGYFYLGSLRISAPHA